MDESPDTQPQESAAAELVRPDGGSPAVAGGADAAALVQWLEQSHRDAAAGRAQARELTRALEQLRDAHEYAGRALREERRRSRTVVAALAVAPLLLALLVWGAWDRLDAVRRDLSGQVAELQTSQAELRRSQDTLALGEAAAAERVRAAALEEELARTRQDLAELRRAASDEATRRERERADLDQRLERAEQSGAAADGLRAQLEALRSKAGADAARADALELQIRRLERELGASRPSDAAAAPPPTSPTSPAPPPAGSASAARPEARPPADAEGAAGDGAVRRPEDLARIRDALNALLAASTDTVRYRIEELGGVRGDVLLDLRVAGLDARGRAIRELEAPEGTIDVRRGSGDVLLELRGGHLVLAGRRAPFFDGRYAVIVPSADVDAWRVSGLTCVRFD